MTLSAVHPLEHDNYPTRRDEERWIERQDPVFWNDWTPEAPVTRAQVNSFEANGFLVLQDIFGPQEVEALQAESAHMRSGEVDIAPDNLVTEPGSNAVRTIFRLEKENALFDRLSRDARVAGKVRYLLGEDIYLHQSRLNYKPGFTGKEFYWHSDFETWHAEDGMPRMRAISASILLTDNDALNGPLMLMPGSHKHYISCAGETPDDNHKSSLKKQEVGVPSQQALSALSARSGIDYAAGKAGTVILFDCNTIHGSNGNITPNPRSNAFFVYNAWSNQLTEPFAANAPRPGFLAERNPSGPISIENGTLNG